MNEAIAIFQKSVQVVCLFGLVAIFAAYLGVLMYRTFGDVLRDTRLPLLALMPLFLISLHDAYSKSGGSVTPRAIVYWDEGIHDDGSSLDTNDWHTVNFKWRYDEWVIPTSVVSIRAFDKDGVYTNEIPVESGQLVANNIPIAEKQASVFMERESTNYFYYVEHSYIPDAPVVTNGVYHIQCVDGKDVWVPIGLTIREGNRIISPQITEESDE